MNYSHYTPSRLPLSTANCHGEKITFASYIQVIGSLSPCQKNEVVFLGQFVQYFHRTLIMM